MKAGSDKLLVPGFLMPGDTIGIVAPSSPFDMENFRRGVAVLEDMGFHVHAPEGLFKKSAYLAGSDSHRARMVNLLFSNAKIKGIVCARGGFGAMRILSLLNYEIIIKNPKFFIGFSDISAILSALYTRCGLITFHGPMVSSLGRATQRTKDALRSALLGDKKIEIRLKSGVTIQSGATRGPVIGGNLTTLVHLMGTPFMPSFKGHILFLEDRGEAAYRIDRMLTQMKMAGCFDGILGLALGYFNARNRMHEIFKIVAHVFTGLNIPILAGFDVGHGRTNLTLPLGLPAALDADAHVLQYS
ncbi:MAG: LD-carboxypeptidase [Desulfobacterales bacterium]|nr:LD-carboxypeptidase [Desulfobacterales bacterium]